MIIIQQRLEAELDASRKKCGELQKEHNRTDQLLGDYKEKIETVETDKDRIAQEKSDLSKKMEQSQRDWHTKEVAWDKEKEYLVQEHKKDAVTKEKYLELQKKFDNLKVSSSQMDNELKKAKQNLDNLKQSIQILERQLKSADMAKGKLEKEKATWDNRAKQSELALEAANGRLIQLKAEYDKKLGVSKEKETVIMKKQEKIQHLQGDLARLNNSLQAKENEIKTKQSEINFMQVILVIHRCDMCTLRKLRGVLWLTRNLIQCSHRIQRLRMQVMCSSESTKVFQVNLW
jgi:chromosome segregation ATPase